jgi:hypothetical protein
MEPPRLETLDAIEAAVWRELAHAVRDKAHGWRLCVLATRRVEGHGEGDGADARSVVLREWSAATRTLQIFTDARSPKAHQILAHPEGMLVMWSAALAWQLRVRVRLSLETSGLAVSSQWARLKLTPARFDYLSPLPPGTPMDGPATPQPMPEPERESRDHFAVIAAEVGSVDWLELRTEGHRRALFSATERRWLTP